jgi:predicted Zn-dependent peptidase
VHRPEHPLRPRVGHDARALLNGHNQLAGDPGYLGRHLGRIAAIQPDDLRAAAQTWLPEGRRVVTFVTPKSGAPKGGRVVTRSKP